MLYTALIVIHIVLAVGLIAVVLVQRGPGATMGAAFGAGASGTVFGSKGSGGFLSKLTGWIGVAFFVISLSMAMLLARIGGSTPDAQDLGVAEQIIEAPELVIPPLSEEEQSGDTFLAPPSDVSEETALIEATADEADAAAETQEEPTPEPPPEDGTP